MWECLTWKSAPTEILCRIRQNLSNIKGMFGNGISQHLETLSKYKRITNCNLYTLGTFQRIQKTSKWYSSHRWKSSGMPRIYVWRSFINWKLWGKYSVFGNIVAQLSSHSEITRNDFYLQMCSERLLGINSGHPQKYSNQNDISKFKWCSWNRNDQGNSPESKCLPNQPGKSEINFSIKTNFC